MTDLGFKAKYAKSSFSTTTLYCTIHYTFKSLDTEIRSRASLKGKIDLNDQVSFKQTE